MKKIFQYSTPVFLFVLMFASCKKEGIQYKITDGNFPQQLSASSSDVALAQSTDADTVITFAWSAATFGSKPVVSYTLQLTPTSDTADWSTAKTYLVGNATYSYGFNGKDLNTLLNGMGLTPGTAVPIAVRIKADVNQYNGSASTIQSVYSNTVVVNFTTYGLSLYIPGAYQNWDPSSAPLLNLLYQTPGIYEAYEYMPGSGLQYYKFTNAPDWNHINYGDGGSNTNDGVVSGVFSEDGAAGGLYSSDGGYIRVTANMNDNTWTATPMTWGIIGDATPNGWNGDTDMSYDSNSQTWTVTADMIHNGSFKFRANHAWSIDFGVDADGNLKYADNPLLPYDASVGNITVPEDGKYTITLDLHVSGNYTYSLHKN
ncbi:MAG: SusE domain-containing protein [Parafilimonas sp.]